MSSKGKPMRKGKGKVRQEAEDDPHQGGGVRGAFRRRGGEGYETGANAYHGALNRPRRLKKRRTGLAPLGRAGGGICSRKPRSIASRATEMPS